MTRRLPFISIAALLLLFTAGGISAQVINKRITIYDGALRIIDTPDSGATQYILALGSNGTGISSTNEIYLAPEQSKPMSFFRGFVADTDYAGLYLNSGTAPFSALEVHATSPTNPAILVEQLNAAGYAGYFGGDLVVDGGDLVVTGSKTASVETSQGRVFLHALESPEVQFSDYGTGRLSNGQTRVSLDAQYAESIEGAYLVFLTAMDSTASLTIVYQDAKGFDVRGTGDAAFRYEVVGTRKGFDERRF